MKESFDYVIVGGGSAGCALANRLSADRGLVFAAESLRAFAAIRSAQSIGTPISLNDFGIRISSRIASIAAIKPAIE